MDVTIILNTTVNIRRITPSPIENMRMDGTEKQIAIVGKTLNSTSLTYIMMGSLTISLNKYKRTKSSMLYMMKYRM